MCIINRPQPKVLSKNGANKHRYMSGDAKGLFANFSKKRGRDGYFKQVVLSDLNVFISIFSKSKFQQRSLVADFAHVTRVRMAVILMIMMMSEKGGGGFIDDDGIMSPFNLLIELAIKRRYSFA